MKTGSAFGLAITGSYDMRVVRVSGRLVAGAGAEAPAWALTSALGNVEHVVMDLTEVTAIDASGIGRLVGLRQALVRRGARLVVATASPRVRRVLQLTGLDAIFGIASGDAGGGACCRGFTSPVAGLCRCA